MIIKEEFADIATPTGPMRLHLFRPAAAASARPALARIAVNPPVR
jgi:hypothetical protein